MTTGEPPPATLSVPAAARRMGLGREQVLRLVRNGSLGVRRFPGLRPQVLEADVDRLVSESVTPASRPSGHREKV
jgi:excisionase family DNA binding protein